MQGESRQGVGVIDATASANQPELPFARPVKGRVLIVHEHALLASALRAALTDCGWIVETSSGPTDCHVLERAGRFQPDCVLLDVDHGDGIGNGIEMIRPLVAAGHTLVMLTEEGPRLTLAECLAAGAQGWINTTFELDEVDSLLESVVVGTTLVGRTERAELLQWLTAERARGRSVRARFESLSPTEAAVLCALADGFSAEEIAHRHVVAVTTVRSQIRAVLHKLGARSQLAAVALVEDHRSLLHTDDPVDHDELLCMTAPRRPFLPTLQVARSA